jgi:hypothetical protein
LLSEDDNDDKNENRNDTHKQLPQEDDNKPLIHWRQNKSEHNERCYPETTIVDLIGRRALSTFVQARSIGKSKAIVLWDQEARKATFDTTIDISQDDVIVNLDDERKSPQNYCKSVARRAAGQVCWDYEERNADCGNHH